MQSLNFPKFVVGESVPIVRFRAVFQKMHPSYLLCSVFLHCLMWHPPKAPINARKQKKQGQSDARF